MSEFGASLVEKDPAASDFRTIWCIVLKRVGARGSDVVDENMNRRPD
jgi:hypothetical protein